MFNLLAENITFGDGLLYALVGFIVVFLGIAILITVVYLFGKLLKSTRIRSERNLARANQTTQVKCNDEIPEHIKVAIIGAVSAYLAEPEGRPCEFKVKRIKR